MPSPQDNDTFFLPDLCSVQPLFLLVLLAELLALVMVLLQQGLAAFAWPDFALTSLFMLACTLASAGAICTLRPRLAQRSLALAAAVCYVLILGVVAAATLVGQWLLQGVLAAPGTPALDGTRLLENLLVAAVIAGIGLRYAYLTNELRLREQGEMSAQLDALQARIRPHFLFNSLNSIASLIAIDAHKAEQAVEDLAALFRASLQNSRTLVPWREERELCERYLRIEQLRLGERLRVNWRVEAIRDDHLLPALSLQPLLENAVVHGIQELPDGGCIDIEGHGEHGHWVVAVSNPRRAAGEPHEAGNRMALDNIHRRLRAIYGSEAGLRREVTPERYRVELRWSAERSR